MRILKRGLITLVMALTVPASSVAHEFWIDPVEFRLEPGDTLQAALRVGQNFSGSSLVYFPRNFSRFELDLGGTLAPVAGAIGDRPAMSVPATEPGLGVIVHETTLNHLTYTDWDLFVGFVEHKGFEGALERHAARGLPQTGFTELYSRHVKSLVAVGDGAGQDRAYGLETEFVALANPYTDDLSGGMPMQLFLRGEPRADAQVELWDRAPDGSVTVSVHHTDVQGLVTLPVEAGHVYMADAVVLEELPPGAPRDAVWLSLWASLTFAVP